MTTDSARRVASNTDPDVNARIRRQTEMSLAYHAAHPERIERRLLELDREWDVERALEAGSATLSLAGLTLALGVNRRWLLLPLAVQAFFLQHAVQGWCPPVPVFRRLGFRTPLEIDEERCALRALREGAGPDGPPAESDVAAPKPPSAARTRPAPERGPAEGNGPHARTRPRRPSGSERRR
jgi:hypothetical protein